MAVERVMVMVCGQHFQAVVLPPYSLFPLRRGPTTQASQTQEPGQGTSCRLTTLENRVGNFDFLESKCVRHNKARNPLYLQAHSFPLTLGPGSSYIRRGPLLSILATI
jgi:hypothetical protein